MTSRGLQLASAAAATAMAVVTLALTAVASATGTPTVSASSGPLTATIQPGTHHPKINTRWPLIVTATLQGKPARASSLYQFLFAGAVVNTQQPFGKKPFWFTGHYSDTFKWPRDSLGQLLTLQVVVSAAGHTVHLDWAVTTVK